MLIAHRLTKRYNNQTVLYPAEITFSPGEAVGIAGANGSGKSTLLSILAQTLSPDSGDILEDQSSVLGNRRFLRQSVGYVPQQDSLIPELTVKQQLFCWQSITGRSILQDPNLMDLLDLKTLFKKPISKLSGGMRKRVSFSLALAGMPRYLIMDEAFSALDHNYRNQLEIWLKDYVNRGGTLIWCSHEPEELHRLCNRVITLADGQIISATN